MKSTQPFASLVPGASRLFSSRFFSVLPVAFALAFVWPLSSGHKVQMMAGTATPGAQATITVKTSNNHNTGIDIKAQNLAEPSSLTPPENVYVVWIEAPGQSPQNVGQLRVSQKEQGELHTETSYKRFQVFITAEENSQAQMPDGPKILSADISHP